MGGRTRSVLIPAMGLSSRFAVDGHNGPKGLLNIEYLGERLSMIRRIARSIPRGWRAVVVAPIEYRARFQAELPVDSLVVGLEGSTRGQSDTILTGLNFCNPLEPVIIQNCDVVFSAALYRKITSNLPFKNLVALHEDRGDDPIFSYVNDPSKPSGFAEKDRISRWAQTGLWMFNKPNYLSECIREQISLDITHNGEFYLSGALNLYTDPIRGVIVNDEDWLDLGTPAAVQRVGASIV